MASRDEIRSKLDKAYKLWGFEVAQRNTLVNTTLACLHSQGVVIEVDRGLPKWTLGSFLRCLFLGISPTSYPTTEPLVEE